MKNKKRMVKKRYHIRNIIGRKGMVMLSALILAILFIALAAAITARSLLIAKRSKRHQNKIVAMSVAEGGINYYLWHLAHSSTDYCDGGACPPLNADGSYGPFTHDYKDQSGNVIGSYDIYITPPGAGDTVTTVKAVGRVTNDAVERSVIAQLGMPSFTKYTLLVNNDELWVGPDETINGSVFINHNGVRNSGEITEDVSSTEATYTSGMFGGSHLGVWGSGTFGGAKLFPVPPIDLNQLNVDMVKIRDAAKNDGEGDYYTTTTNYGYHIILKATKYEIRTVRNYSSSGYNITNETASVEHDYPAVGVIVCEDNVWIEGTVNNKQLTVLAADLTAPIIQKRIVVVNNLKYTNYDGRDKLGLITQTNIFVPRNAPTNMEIDAAMIAKEGEIKINPYPYKHKTKIKVYGSMAHNTGLVWTYCYNYPSCSRWSGYQTTETVVDNHNIIQPPPKFPLTGSYAVLNWREE